MIIYIYNSTNIKFHQLVIAVLQHKSSATAIASCGSETDQVDAEVGITRKRSSGAVVGVTGVGSEETTLTKDQDSRSSRLQEAIRKRDEVVHDIICLEDNIVKAKKELILYALELDDIRADAAPETESAETSG